MPDYLRVYEVGPRDGLQNEAILISTEDIKHIEVRIHDASIGGLAGALLPLARAAIWQLTALKFQRQTSEESN